jgi:hypothetical protein
MHIFIDLSTTGGPCLVDESDFSAFKVVIAGDRDIDRARAALLPIVELVDEGHATVDANHLELLAGDVARSAEWKAGFSAMLDYARSRGWIEQRGSATLVRAHVEWAD